MTSGVNKMKHNEILKNVKSRLEKICDEVRTEQEYVCSGGCGEYDVAGIRFGFLSPDTLYAVEVKGRDTIKNKQKALHQLGKDYIHFKEELPYYTNIKLFYAYTDASMRRGYNIKEIK
jgi:hypothetical protein